MEDAQRRKRLRRQGALLGVIGFVCLLSSTSGSRSGTGAGIALLLVGIALLLTGLTMMVRALSGQKRAPRSKD